MSRKIYVREVYFYIVCIISLIIFIIGLVNLSDNLISYFKPLAYATRTDILPRLMEQYPELSTEELDKIAEEEIEAAKNYERNRGLRGITRGIIMLAISIPLFVFHWKKAQVLWQLGSD